MRRILLLITDMEIGGTPTVVRELAIRLNAAGGAVVEVACLSRPGPVSEQLQAAAVTVHALDARGSRDFPRTIKRLVRLARERQFDTIFGFLVHANVVAAAASQFLPNVRLLQSIQTTQPRPRWHWIAQAIAQHAAETIVVPSPSVARVAEQWSHVPREKIVVIPNAVDIAAFSATPDLRPSESRRVGFVGRLDPIKRVPLLVDAMTHLPTDWRLEIFGDGPDRARIEAAVKVRSLENRVTLHGRIDHPQAAFQQIDVLALPSEAEGFGLVLIEAMAAGVPVVAADVPGVQDVVRNGENGLLIDVRDGPKFAVALQKAIAQRTTLTANGLDTVRQRYEWPPVLARYRRVLEIR
ncbi:MAG TPA: glycosyltransferase family 4 protein [Tepidisphaeraceae bacterium]|jgi:glycosyltransferase involved in cell wall biosynthesis|nr:glycosyltransferase family 4 protein [Tepidisphaeraceae bacterium]